MQTQTVERQELQRVIDTLPDDRVVAALDFLRELRQPYHTLYAPESLTVNTKEELYEMLEAGRNQIREGKVIDADDVMTQLKDKYEFSG